MKVTVATLSDTVFTLDVSPDMELENFKALCEAESSIAVLEIVLLFNGQPLVGESLSMGALGVADGDMIMMDRKRASAPRRAAPASQTAGGGGMFDFSQIQVPGGGGGGSGAAASASSGAGSSRPRATADQEDPATIRDMLRANPDQLAMLKQNNPRLSEALESGDLDKFSLVLKEQQDARMERERLRIRMLNADPFDLETQKMIQQEIEQKNIDANMELAMEASPESFGTVIMLYINCTVNGHNVKAFVDSGAQATIMSQAAAERCGIMRLVDQRWAGIAKGVGTQKIIGRVHMAQIQIESDYLTSSFSILEDQPMDMLLGLDMLKKHQCTIDLKRNCLVFGTNGTETTFLSEADLPLCARLSGSGKEGEKEEEAALKASVQDSANLEDKQLTEALARSATETKMDTSESKSEASGSGEASTAETGSVGTDFKETDVANLMAMGFPREACITELRKVGGDVNLAIANMFARSLSEKFNQKK